MSDIDSFALKNALKKELICLVFITNHTISGTTLLEDLLYSFILQKKRLRMMLCCLGLEIKPKAIFHNIKGLKGGHASSQRFKVTFSVRKLLIGTEKPFFNDFSSDFWGLFKWRYICSSTRYAFITSFLFRNKITFIWG